MGTIPYWTLGSLYNLQPAQSDEPLRAGHRGSSDARPQGSNIACNCRIWKVTQIRQDGRDVRSHFRNDRFVSVNVNGRLVMKLRKIKLTKFSHRTTSVEYIGSSTCIYDLCIADVMYNSQCSQLRTYRYFVHNR